MAVDFSNVLVVGVSTRSLFNLEKENELYEKEGIAAYRRYQLDHENEPLEHGTAFALVRNLLKLNELSKTRLVEVVVMSRNSPETGVRVLHSLKAHGLDITRLALTGGEPLAPYIQAYDIDLFLSKDAMDVQNVIDSGQCAAAMLYAPPAIGLKEDSKVRIAFDADAVLFSDESELRFKTEGLDAFQAFERENEKVSLNEGPFAKLLLKLSLLQSQIPLDIEDSPLCLAIVTARSAPSHMRVINTLRAWGVYVNQTFFLGGLPKDKVLQAFGAHIFFDDQEYHLDAASKVVPSGKVPYNSNSLLRNKP